MQANTLTINAKLRDTKNKTGEGFIPAVYYGAHAKSTPISINEIEFTKVLRQAGESTPVKLKTENGEETAMIHAVQYDPVKDLPTHVDFYIVEKGQKVHVDVPLEFTGEAPATKNGGILVKVMHEISLNGEPANMPHEITVDISSLVEMDSVILVKDLKLPAGVELYHVEGDEVVASIALQKEEEETPVSEVDLSSIEVEAKGKKEEAGEEASE
jgi:large subunit ribosomal protein L25